jgi:hypothetical protein
MKPRPVLVLVGKRCCCLNFINREVIHKVVVRNVRGNMFAPGRKQIPERVFSKNGRPKDFVKNVGNVPRTPVYLVALLVENIEKTGNKCLRSNVLTTMAEPVLVVG